MAGHEKGSFKKLGIDFWNHFNELSGCLAADSLICDLLTHCQSDGSGVTVFLAVSVGQIPIIQLQWP